MKQQGSLRTGPDLGQHLRGQHPEREPGVDDAIRQAVRSKATALDDRIEADFLGIANAVGEVGEDLAVLEIRRVHDVSGSAESIGEGEAPARQAQRVMKEQNLSHVDQPNPIFEIDDGHRTHVRPSAAGLSVIATDVTGAAASSGLCSASWRHRSAGEQQA